MARQKLEERRSNAPPLTCETRSLIINLMNKLVTSERNIEKLRLDARDEGFTSLREIFDEFDWMCRGYLTVQEIRRHFENYPDETACYRMGKSPDYNLEIELFIRRLNKDKLNGRVSLTEWLDELTPNLK